ncbi:MAG TPA: hypothetical protein VN193_00055 [Candidatus Angelobacter sp.]|nr:hypothetical protein [Candidatus Angelobacter sp.]
MKWPLTAGVSLDVLPSILSPRVAALRRRRRQQRLRTWATPLAVVAVGGWLTLVAMASLGH